jgi:hypothetical protein
MSPLNRVAGHLVIASVLALSACVVGPGGGDYRNGSGGGDYRNDPYREASGSRDGYRHNEADKRCDSDRDHSDKDHSDRDHGNACGEAEHH